MAKPKKILRGVGIGFLVLAVLVLGVLGWFTLREYRPDPVETVETPSGEKTLSLEDSDVYKRQSGNSPKQSAQPDIPYTS